MEVSECDIIEGIKNLRTDVVKSADGEFLRFTGTCTGDELVGNEEIHTALVDRGMGKYGFHCVLIGGDLLLRIASADIHRTNERQQMDQHGAVR